jgi:hypothetical protein
MAQNDTSIRRRDFLARSCVAGTVAALGVSAVGNDVFAGTRTRSRPRSVYDLEQEDWQEFVGSEFEVCGSPFLETQLPAKLVLHEAEHQGYTNDTDRPETVRPNGMSLLFAVRDGSRVDGGTHVVRHPKLGEFLLFLHPVKHGIRQREEHCEAVIN